MNRRDHFAAAALTGLLSTYRTGGETIAAVLLARALEARLDAEDTPHGIVVVCWEAGRFHRHWLDVHGEDLVDDYDTMSQMRDMIVDTATDARFGYRVRPYDKDLYR